MPDEQAAVRPKPVACFVVEPREPAVGDPVRLLDLSYDPGGGGIEHVAWDMGDGTTSLDAGPTHRFERDGRYTVTLHVTASDGRVAVATVPVTVATHDVALTRIAAPACARPGDVAEVAVTVTSRHGPEIVQLELCRRRGSGPSEQIAIHTRSLPGAGVLEVAFPVTFEDADLDPGEVTFNARVALVGAEDATPSDNEQAAPPTVVAHRSRAPGKAR